MTGIRKDAYPMDALDLHSICNKDCSVPNSKMLKDYCVVKAPDSVSGKKGSAHVSLF